MDATEAVTDAAAIQPPSASNTSITIPPSRQHSAELDALRGIAIFSVLFHHFLPETSVLNRMQVHLQQGPTFGVPLFFALSGFLITRILVQSRGTIEAGLTTPGHSLFVFYARRVLRIFPIYYVTLLAGLLLHYTGVRKGLFWHLAYLSNVYYFHRGAFDRGPAPVFWTLSVEEQFYLIWPLVILLLPLRRLKAITLATAIFGGIFAGIVSDRGEVISLLLPANLTCLALGSYLGLTGTAPIGSPTDQQRAMRYFLVAVPVLVAATLILSFAVPASRMTTEAAHAFRYAASALVFAWIVAKLSGGIGGPLGAVMRWKPLVCIGRISYGMYILQFFVSQLMERAVPKVSAHLGAALAKWLLQSFPAVVIASIAAASVSWFCLEKPLNDLKRFFPYPSARSSG